MAVNNELANVSQNTIRKARSIIINDKVEGLLPNGTAMLAI